MSDTTVQYTTSHYKNNKKYTLRDSWGIGKCWKTINPTKDIKGKIGEQLTWEAKKNQKYNASISFIKNKWSKYFKVKKDGGLV